MDTDTMTASPTTPRIGRHWSVVLSAGLAGGLAWGVNARLWMRYITSRAEFTWSGTLFIIIAFGLAALAQAVVYLGRRRALPRSRLTALRVVGVMTLIPLSFGAGGAGFPIIIFGPLALTQRSWSRWTRRAAASVAVLFAVGVAASMFAELSPMRALIGTAWFVSIYAVTVWAARFSLAPQLDEWSAPLALRVLGLVGLAPVVLAGVVVITNL